jgi:hypothetical protein
VEGVGWVKLASASADPPQCGIDSGGSALAEPA